MHSVYILKSMKDGKYYIGSTSNVLLRIKKHNNGGNASTKHRRPLVLVWEEPHANKKLAQAREQEIKRMKGGIQFKKLIQHI